MPDTLGFGVHYASEMCQSKAEVEAERSQEDKLLDALSRAG